MADDKPQLGIAIRFVQQWVDTPDPEHEQAMMLVLRDRRDVPIGRKYCEARLFLKERREQADRGSA